MQQLEPKSVTELINSLQEHDYLADTGLATSVFLSLSLRRPLLLEGDAGVGKTQLAKTLAEIGGGPLIRLQCYEGLDASSAVYSWDYNRQLMHIRASEAVGAVTDDVGELTEEIYSENFLVKRPLLEALQHDGLAPAVLLIDEIDRADDEFEAYLLEFLSEFSITIPELGTIEAKQKPIVVITSNRTRDLHDALKRRAFYHWVQHPNLQREVEIIRRRCTGASEQLCKQVAAVVARFRDLGLYKPPGVSESIDWAHALVRLNQQGINFENAQSTLGVVLKYREDQSRVIDHGLDKIVAVTTQSDLHKADISQPKKPSETEASETTE